MPVQAHGRNKNGHTLRQTSLKLSYTVVNVHLSPVISTNGRNKAFFELIIKWSGNLCGHLTRTVSSGGSATY